MVRLEFQSTRTEKLLEAPSTLHVDLCQRLLCTILKGGMLQEEASAAYHHGLPQMSRSQCSIDNGRVLLNVRSEESRSPAAGEAAIPTCTIM